MRHWIAAVSVLLAAFFLTSCSGSSEPGQQATTERDTTNGELVPGYTGGCKDGFVIFSQNQFDPHGTLVRRTLDTKGGDAGLGGNDELRAVGWVKTGQIFYPENPEGLRGEVWFFVPNLPNGDSGWVSDAGVRAVKTDPAPNNEDKYFDPGTQAVPQNPACELHAR